MAVTLGTSSSVVIGLGGKFAGATKSHRERAKTIGMITLPLAIVFAAYALLTFHWRGRLMYARSAKTFGDTTGPIILGVALAASLTAILFLNLS